MVFYIMHYASRSSNVIIKQCINHAMYHYNTDLGYKFASYHYAYNIDVFCTMNHAINKRTVNELNHDQLILIIRKHTNSEFLHS